MKIKLEILKNYLAMKQELTKLDESLLTITNNLEDELFELESNYVNEDLLKYILFNDFKLDEESKAKIAMMLYSGTNFANEKEDFWSLPVKNLSNVIEIYEKYLKTSKYNFDLKFDGKYFPISVAMTLFNATRHYPRFIRIKYNIKFENLIHEHYSDINNDWIQNAKNCFHRFNFGDLVSCFNLYPQKASVSNFEKENNEAKNMILHNGTQFISNGNGVRVFTQGSRHLKNADLEIRCLSNSGKETKVVLDCTNNTIIDIENLRSFTELPYVKIFSLSNKEYFFVYVKELKEYIYNDNAIDELVLPEQEKSILTKLFSVAPNTFHKDLADNKGGGLIILAEGEPGTGKTSTAEVYSELKHRVLYIVQIDELGTSAKNIEVSLETILNRVRKWNAILLFDEVDIYLSKRDNDIEKAAIVGVFLRLLEYFDGTIFFTTNCTNSIDSAILSRVTLKVNYPPLDIASRKLIWLKNLEKANIKIDSINKLAQIKMNGREIRNYTKLATVLYNDNIKEAQLIGLIERFPK
ncbi:MAG: hypothetical protein RL660_1128 [Bacteroidota bacterium]|jgi:hypothetical protein